MIDLREVGCVDGTCMGLILRVAALSLSVLLVCLVSQSYKFDCQSSELKTLLELLLKRAR
jgi:hypothetical protein